MQDNGSIRLVRCAEGMNKTKTISLSQGQVALVDDADFEWLSQWKWCADHQHNSVYAIRAGSYRKIIYMHRLIMDAKPGQMIDHRNNNGLDNQRGNLRHCTNMQNARNSIKKKKGSSRFKGVCWKKSNRNWTAQIRLRYKSFHIGSFASEIDAARAYDVKAKELFGEFAKTNF
ncbi:hypothetical protein IMZ68_06850 [Candidatus Bathyarchaeota archaeon]|nr:hypothetical protein [Candidatus Bathyarchaeota archaeon]